MDDFVEVGVLRSSLSHDREIAVDAQLLYRVRQAVAFTNNNQEIPQIHPNDPLGTFKFDIIFQRKDVQ